MKISWDNLTSKDKARLNQEIYKFMDLKYLLKILTENKLSFLKVNNWDDPYENFIFKSDFHIGNKKIDTNILMQFADSSFGQSWTLNTETDALWRIYSPSKNSVRIRTTIGKLYETMLTKSDDSLYCLLGDVKYKNKSDFENFSKTLKSPTDFKTDKFHEFSYFVKRKEFEHEKEFRAIYISDFIFEKFQDPILNFDVIPNNFIIDILLDPRLNAQEVDTVKDEIIKAGYSGNIEQSSLYYWKPLKINLL